MRSLRLFITGLSLGQNGFNPRLFHVGLVVDKAALMQLFSKYFRFARQQLCTNISN